MSSHAALKGGSPSVGIQCAILALFFNLKKIREMEKKENGEYEKFSGAQQNKS